VLTRIGPSLYGSVMLRRASGRERALDRDWKQEFRSKAPRRLGSATADEAVNSRVDQLFVLNGTSRCEAHRATVVPWRAVR
jgi:hypothetical protein